MTVVLLILAALLAVAGWRRAIAHCRGEVQVGKAAARRRAAAAFTVEQVSVAWDSETARLAAAVQTVYDSPLPTTGFGDSLVAAERMRLALAPPPPTQEDWTSS